jgi:putative ABC transport system permease protein
VHRQPPVHPGEPVGQAGQPLALRVGAAEAVVTDHDPQHVAVPGGWQTLADAHAGQALTAPGQFDIGLRPGVPAASYAQSIGTRLGSSYATSLNTRNSVVVSLMLGLIGTLTVLLALVAGLGVLNTWSCTPVTGCTTWACCGPSG